MVLLIALLSSKELEATLDSLGTILAVFTFLVVLGLIFEYWHDIIEFVEEWRRPAALFPWKRFMELCGGITVTIGVAGELAVQFRASHVETDLRASNNAEFLRQSITIKDLGTISSKARTDAESATAQAS